MNGLSLHVSVAAVSLGVLVGSNFATGCGGKAVIDVDVAEDGSGGTDPFGGVVCGVAGTCTFSCCLDLTQEDGAPFCATSCPFDIGSFACDGPEDCEGGVCCGDVTGTSCRDSCGGNMLEMCNTDSDCDGGFCSPASVAGIDQSSCMR